jgi:hypothetical protein
MPVAAVGATSVGVPDAGACGVTGLLALVPAREAACGVPADCDHPEPHARLRATIEEQKERSLADELRILTSQWDHE